MPGNGEHTLGASSHRPSKLTHALLLQADVGRGLRITLEDFIAGRR